MYKNSVPASQEAHGAFIAAKSRLGLFGGINPSFLSGNYKKHVNTLCGRNAEILLAKTLVILIANAA
jgi:hypothetical protein